MQRWIMAALAVSASSAIAAAKTPCDIAAPCRAGAGEYALVFPPDWNGATLLPALVFFHGHNSSMDSTIRMASLRESFAARGWLVVAPQGEREAEGAPRRWPGRPDPGWRDDRAFTLAVLEDVAARAPLAGKPVLSGFSAGGSMAWMMSCYEGARFAALISIAGALRQPNAEPCPQSVPRALHIHGFADQQVPLEGRAIRDWRQGSVAETLAGFRRANGCRDWPEAISAEPGAWRSRAWTGCAGGGDLLYLEHDGGHSLPPGWGEAAARWLFGE